MAEMMKIPDSINVLFNSLQPGDEMCIICSSNGMSPTWPEPVSIGQISVRHEQISVRFEFKRILTYFLLKSIRLKMFMHRCVSKQWNISLFICARFRNYVIISYTLHATLNFSGACSVGFPTICICEMDFLPL